MSYATTKIKVRCSDKSIEVEAFSIGKHFAIHRQVLTDDDPAPDRQWVVTHVATGLRAASAPTRRGAVLAARRFSEKDKWSFGPEVKLTKATTAHGMEVNAWIKERQERQEARRAQYMPKWKINEDKTVSFVVSRARREAGLGSMYEIGAEGAVPHVNALSKVELIAVLVARQTAPFPLGGGVEVYQKALEYVRSGKAFRDAEIDKHDLGPLRRALAQESAGGCNAPTDNYLRIAASLARGEVPEPY